MYVSDHLTTQSAQKRSCHFSTRTSSLRLFVNKMNNQTAKDKQTAGIETAGGKEGIPYVWHVKSSLNESGHRSVQTGIHFCVAEILVLTKCLPLSIQNVDIMVSLSLLVERSGYHLKIIAYMQSSFFRTTHSN